MECRFVEEEGGLFSFSEAPIKLGLYKCTWMALSTLYYGGCSFWVIFLLFQVTPPFRLSLSLLRANPPVFHHSLLIGSELALLAMVAFMTWLVPTLIMTWITALVFQHLFGRGLFGRRKGIVQEGSLIARDIFWMALKSVVKQGNVAAVLVLVCSLLACGFMNEDERTKT